MRPLITLLVCVTLTALGQQQDVFGSVAGRVFDAASNQPIAEATVFLIGLTKAGTLAGKRGNAADLRRTVKSSADGTFQFSRVPAGNYGVRATLDLMGGGPFVTDASYFTITVQGGKESGGNEIAMRTQFCQIAGTVLQASTRATLAGVTVTLTEAKGSRRILHTNAKGEFSTVLPPGTYRLAAEYEGFVTASAIAPVTAAIGQRSTGIEIVMNMVAGGAAPIPEATPPSGEFALAPDVSVSSGPFMIDPATCPAASSKITGTAFVRYTLTLSPFGASNPKFARFLMTQDFNGSGKDASGNGYVVVGFSSIDFEGERSPSPMTNDTELNGRLTAEVIPAAGSNGRGYKMVQIIKGKLSGPESKPKLPVVMSTHPDGCFPFTKLGG